MHAGDRPVSSFLEFEHEWASFVVGRALSSGRLAELASPLQVLRTHDITYDTDYVATADAWLSYPPEHRRLRVTGARRCERIRGRSRSGCRRSRGIGSGLP